jgi:hypothetical protein
VEVRACERSREPAFGGRHTELSSPVCVAERRWHGPFNTDGWRFTSWPPPLSSLPAATSASGGYLVGPPGAFCFACSRHLPTLHHQSRIRRRGVFTCSLSPCPSPSSKRCRGVGGSVEHAQDRWKESCRAFPLANNQTPITSRPVPTARRRLSIKLRSVPSLKIRIALSTGVGSVGVSMRPSKTDRERFPHFEGRKGITTHPSRPFLPRNFGSFWAHGERARRVHRGRQDPYSE